MTEHEKISRYELQKIDCNCSDCYFMRRDLDRYAYWEEWHKQQDYADFQKKKEKAIKDAEAILIPQQRQTMLKKAHKLIFQFNKPSINYGVCEKFNKSVSFIPGVCQPDTQHCFIHRKDKQELQTV